MGCGWLMTSWVLNCELDMPTPPLESLESYIQRPITANICNFRKSGRRRAIRPPLGLRSGGRPRSHLPVDHRTLLAEAFGLLGVTGLNGLLLVGQAVLGGVV